MKLLGVSQVGGEGMRPCWAGAASHLSKQGSASAAQMLGRAVAALREKPSLCWACCPSECLHRNTTALPFSKRFILQVRNKLQPSKAVPLFQVSPAQAVWNTRAVYGKGGRTKWHFALTICRYSRIIFNLSSPPLFSSFCSMLLIILQEALLAPITFLYATERRFLSSTVNSTSIPATFFIDSTISRRKRSGNYSHTWSIFQIIQYKMHINENLGNWAPSSFNPATP